MKLDFTSKDVNRESPSNISGRLPVRVLKLAEKVSIHVVREFNEFNQGRPAGSKRTKVCKRSEFDRDGTKDSRISSNSEGPCTDMALGMSLSR